MNDLFICKRTVGGHANGEGTRYYIYEEVKPYTPGAENMTAQELPPAHKIVIHALEKANVMLYGYGCNNTVFIRDAIKAMYSL